MSYLGIAHTPSQHNLSASLIGSQHTYDWRVYGKGTKPYWFHNTAHYKEPYFNSLHFPNLFTGADRFRMVDPICLGDKSKLQSGGQQTATEVMDKWQVRSQLNLIPY